MWRVWLSISPPAVLQFPATLYGGAGTIFQQGRQDQPFPAGGLGDAVRPQRGPGQSPGGKRILTTIFEN